MLLDTIKYKWKGGERIMAEHISGRANTFDKVEIIEEHLHSKGFVYPELANTVQLTAGAGVWAAYPTPTEIIPANTIVTDFDIHFVSVSGISANGSYMLELYQGAALSETGIGEIDFYRNAVQSQEGSQPFLSFIVKANSRISAAISSGNAAADTCNIKLRYHVY